MHVLAANSVATLLNYLEEQLQHTPTPAQIQGTQKEDEVDEEKPEGEGVEQKVWLVNWDHSIDHIRILSIALELACNGG